MENNTAILVITYRRPDFTLELLNELPKDRKIYIVSDGLKTSAHSEDWTDNRAVIESYAATNYLVKVNFRSVNLGGRDGVPAAVDWVLEQEIAVIVLEDDCRPCPLFYDFCDFHIAHSLNEHITFISGNNHIVDKFSFKRPILSKFPHCWGWATNRSSWLINRPFRDELGAWKKKYGESEVERIGKLRKNVRDVTFGNVLSRRFWYITFSDLISEKKYHWDYCYTMNMWMNGSYALLPPVNLVTNIGDDHRSLNTTRRSKHQFAANTVSPAEVDMLFNLDDLIVYNKEHDRQIQNKIWPKIKMLYHISGPLKTFAMPIISTIRYFLNTAKRKLR